VEQIKQTTKQEIIDLFMKHIHPSSATRSKLSIHMDSQAPPPAKESEDEVNKEATESKNDVEESVAEPSGAAESSVEDVKASQDVGAAKIRDSNVVIEDIIEWKAGLVCSPAARPLAKLIVAQETT
jgi:insulysin